MSSRLCVMTAYADETKVLLDVLKPNSSDSVAWNGRLQFEWCDGDRKWSVMQSGMGKVRAASTCQMIIDNYRVETFFEFGFAGWFDRFPARRGHCGNYRCLGSRCAQQAGDPQRAR